MQESIDTYRGDNPKNWNLYQRAVFSGFGAGLEAIYGAGQAIVGLDKRLVRFFGMEEGFRRADRRGWGDDEETVESIFRTELQVQDLARSRATRFEIFGAGFFISCVNEG